MLQNSSMIFKSLVSTKRHAILQPSLHDPHILRCPAHAPASARTVVLLAPRCPGFRHRRKLTLDPSATRKIWIKNRILLRYCIYAQKNRSLLIFLTVSNIKNTNIPPISTCSSKGRMFTKLFCALVSGSNTVHLETHHKQFEDELFEFVAWIHVLDWKTRCEQN